LQKSKRSITRVGRSSNPGQLPHSHSLINYKRKRKIKKKEKRKEGDKKRLAKEKRLVKRG
jgi:hypothetical protein